MSRLRIRDESELAGETLSALAITRVNDTLAPVYLQLANSEVALRAYLRMEQSLRDGSLSAQEIEAIKLFVSERSGCKFCLAVHQGKAARAGIDADAQSAIRQGRLMGQARIDVIIEIVSYLLKTPGAVPVSLINKARDVNLDDENLVDLVMAISTIFFTNLCNHVNDTQVA